MPQLIFGEFLLIQIKTGPPGDIGPDGFPGRRGDDGEIGEYGEIGDKGARVSLILLEFNQIVNKLIFFRVMSVFLARKAEPVFLDCMAKRVLEVLTESMDAMEMMARWVFPDHQVTLSEIFDL